MATNKFTSDGCSGFMSWTWRKFTGHGPPWEKACVEHDRKYWRGGTRKDRLRADNELLRDVANMNHPVWAILMWIAVRVGGGPHFPFRKKWNCCDGRFKNMSYGTE